MRIARFICSLLLAVGLLAIPVQSRAQVAVGISVQFGPPVLPVYVQPICPEPGCIWVPVYWAWGPDGYFWVPSTWVKPPEVGLLWTPGYWAFEDGLYVWSPGYWGPEVGFYGGINYGFGYTGVGFFGGYWRGGTYYYNRSVTNVDVTVVRNTYNTTVINNNVNRVSSNGGRGGITAHPTSQEMAADRQRHFSMTCEQTQHQQTVRANRPRITGAPSKTVQPPRGPQMLRASILVWSRSNTEKWKRCASSRMWSARRSNSGTSRNSKNWNGRGRISSGRNSSSAASNSKWGKCSRNTLNNRKSSRSASNVTCRNKTRNNQRASGPQRASNSNKTRRPDLRVRPSIQTVSSNRGGDPAISPPLCMFSIAVNEMRLPLQNSSGNAQACVAG